jgi:toxin-antitoxin system PIN domain toxin
MRFLLDINVLIALIDPTHIRHDHAHEWFASQGQGAWATCPLIENGVIRIVGHPRYPNSPGTPAVVAKFLGSLRQLPGYAFWPDDISLLKHEHCNTAHLLDSAQVTDTYLLALARAHEGQLATFDQRLVTDAVAEGRQSLHVIH